MSKEIVRAPGDLSVWRENIEALAQRQPVLAEVLRDYMACTSHGLEHYEARTPGGRWIDGLTEYPFFEASGEPRFAWSKKTREPAVFFQYGAGMPPYLSKSVRALPKEAVSWLVVEPNIALLAYALHATRIYADAPSGCDVSIFTVPDTAPGASGLFGDPDRPEEERNNRIRAVVGHMKDEALTAAFSAFGVYSVSNSMASVHPGLERAMEERFREMAMAVSEWSILRVTKLGNSAEDTLLGLRQMAVLSPWISYGSQFSSLIGKHAEPCQNGQNAGRPAVVVSAGPSLDRNFELLREIEDKFIVIASDAVLGKMIRSGIAPHIVCCLERGLPTYDAYFAENLDRYPHECSKILLISQAVCTPKIYGRWPGPKILIGKGELPLDRWFIADTLGGDAIRSGLSVAHMCYSVAVSLGASRIALIGQDLAYAADGFMHAEGVYGSAARSAMRRRETDDGMIKIPGALGGEVFTNDIFLMFLREMESMVESFGIAAYDCTEGGALIAGTTAEPFADFIAREAAGLTPITDETRPSEIVRKAGLPPERERRHAELAERMEKKRAELDECERTLGEIRESLGKIAAPGLDTKRRFERAVKIGRAFSEMHGKNRMLAFVTQSYFSSSTAQAARVRFLDGTEMAKRWAAIYEEIVSAHLSVLAFARQWLAYAGTALDYYAARELPMTPPEAPFEMFEAIMRGANHAARRLEMDYLLSAADMARLRWPGRSLWQCAMFLLDEGRSAEAAVLMRTAEADFEGSVMPNAEAAAFLKDYARVLSAADLCYFPPYDRAEVLLDNAVELCGADDEIREIGDKILSGEISHIKNLAYYERSDPDRLVEWKRARHNAIRALWDGDILRAMSLVWEMIRDQGETFCGFPGLVSAHLDWLARQMEKFFGAVDEPYRSGIDGLLSEMASRADILGKFKAAYSAAFVSALAKHGLDVIIKKQGEN
ncbi:MAG: DUF115 domain-containing protein [Synergistaceae bacterium]|jgi:hypothetical protein|nr:DUF115 domain-containing protein [Synergistaceae bacterium]